MFSKPYLNQVVISPLVYGPSVSLATENISGPGLWNHLSASFGYLTKTGYTHNGVTKRFAVVIGETGSNFTTAADLQVGRGGGEGAQYPLLAIMILVSVPSHAGILQSRL